MTDTQKVPEDPIDELKDQPEDGAVDVTEPDIEGPQEIVAVSQTASWAGPLPPPSILRDFGNVVDDGAERIFTAWEDETKHRRRIEIRDSWTFTFDVIGGKILAFVFVVLALLISAYVAVNGAEWFGTILAGGTIASVVWAFVKTGNANSDPQNKDPKD